MREPHGKTHRCRDGAGIGDVDAVDAFAGQMSELRLQCRGHRDDGELRPVGVACDDLSAYVRPPRVESSSTGRS